MGSGPGNHTPSRQPGAGPSALTVDAGQNGGISVEAWDRNDVRVRAIVRTTARTDERTRQLASGVQIQSGGGRVSATGPDTERRENWSVSYRVNCLAAPSMAGRSTAASPVSLTNNGGLKIGRR